MGHILAHQTGIIISKSGSFSPEMKIRTTKKMKKILVFEKTNGANRKSLILGKFSSEIRIFENRFEARKLYPIGIRASTKV